MCFYCYLYIYIVVLFCFLAIAVFLPSSLFLIPGIHRIFAYVHMYIYIYIYISMQYHAIVDLTVSPFQSSAHLVNPQDMATWQPRMPNHSHMDAMC